MPDLVPEPAERRQESAPRNAQLIFLLVEFLAVAFLFGLCGASIPPDVNESHYLTKAKHFWDAAWCPRDFFLTSRDAHHVFFWTVGWLTQLLPLASVAWIARLVAWIGIAWTWQRLSFRIFESLGFALPGAALFCVVLDQFHLAGEWLVGGVEAKCFAYVAVLFAVERALAQRWHWVWPGLVVASAFHVLVGGWMFGFAVLAFAWQKFLQSQSAGQQSQSAGQQPQSAGQTSVGHQAGRYVRMFADQAAWIIAGGIGVVLTAVPAWQLSRGESPEIVAAANETYVQFRLAHHLNYWDFSSTRLTLFFLAVLAWFLLAPAARRAARQSAAAIHQGSPGWPLQTLANFVNLSLAAAGCGILLSTLAELPSWRDFANGLLRFYWFRLSDVLVAIGLSISILLGLRRLLHWLGTQSSTVQVLIANSLSLLLVASVFLWPKLVTQDLRPPADSRSLPTYADNPQRTEGTYRNWVRVCHWIRDNTEPDALFMTPLEQQTFNWYAERSQVVCYKDIPQNASAIVEWRRRLDLLMSRDSNYQFASTEQLKAWSLEFDLQYVVMQQSIVRQRQSAGYPVGLVQVYPADPAANTTYVVFRFNPANSRDNPANSRDNPANSRDNPANSRDATSRLVPASESHGR